MDEIGLSLQDLQRALTNAGSDECIIEASYCLAMQETAVKAVVWGSAFRKLRGETRMNWYYNGIVLKYIKVALCFFEM